MNFLGFLYRNASPNAEESAQTECRPETYCCPYCGAGISRQYLYQGGILGKFADRAVKAKILCRACGRQHALAGKSTFHRGVILILYAQPRGQSRRQGAYRNANVVRTGEAND